ncbi:Nif3-like dinuclear metal center hexameric protein [Cellulomonas bogoriensis]|uniref:Nif3-like dinuclear metal center hexameric protein n=1 Tax=Cellulomonas bogoriensis TaxID=301388 RepID=UPI00068E8266|nr:Nif3-like dinuclear metal center hexameric protein [Cellulomonas bogoriensis]
MRTTARQVIDRIAAHVGTPPRATTVDGFVAGDPDVAVRGVAVTVMATLDVLRDSVARGLDLVVTHEPLYYDHHGTSEAVLAADADPVHAAKAAYVAEHGLVVYRWHDAWHDRRPDGVLTGTARALGWLGAERPDEPGVYDLPSATTLHALAVHVAQALDARALRYVGAPDSPVAVVGLQPGFCGFDRNRRLLARQGVDALVLGEGHEWETGEYAADAVAAGACAGVVVPGHLPSEQEGMVEAHRWLTVLLPELRVELVRAVDPFTAVPVPAATRL